MNCSHFYLFGDRPMRLPGVLPWFATSLACVEGSDARSRDVQAKMSRQGETKSGSVRVACKFRRQYSPLSRLMFTYRTEVLVI